MAFYSWIYPKEIVGGVENPKGSCVDMYSHGVGQQARISATNNNAIAFHHSSRFYRPRDSNKKV